MTFLNIIGFFIMLALLYIGASFTLVSAEFAGFKIRLAKPLDKLYTATWFFTFWPFETFVKFPVGHQFLDFADQKVITKKKTFGSGKNKVIYSQAAITVDAAIYFSWPINSASSLITAWKNVEADPFDKTALLEYFGVGVQATIRRSLGKLSWYECRQGEELNSDGNHIKTINAFLLADSLSDAGVGNSITASQIKHVRFEIKTITLPEGLEDAISAPQIAEYHASAVKITAEGEKTKRAKEGEGDAMARNAVNKVIAKHKDGLKAEALLTLRKMANGQASTIFYELPSEIRETLGKAGITAGDKDLKKIASIMVKELTKLTTKH